MHTLACTTGYSSYPLSHAPTKLTLLTDRLLSTCKALLLTHRNPDAHTLMLFLPPWQEGLSSEPDDSLRLSPFPLLAGVRNKTINKYKREPEEDSTREEDKCLSAFVAGEKGKYEEKGTI